MAINVHTHPLIHTNAVPYPSEKSDVSICLLKYAYCLSNTEETTFSKSSLDKDGHEQGISDLPSLCISPAVLNRLRLDVLKLLCEVTCKYQSVRKRTPSKKIVNDRASQSECNNNGSHHCDDHTDNLSIVSSSTSNLDESSRSDDSDSTFHVEYDDDADERDDSHKLYAVEPSEVVPPKSNICPLQKGGDQNGTADIEDACSVEETNVEDDSSVDEMYSDFRENSMGCGNDVDASDDLEDTDNLVCPGDVLEYITIDEDQAARRSTVDAIIESGTETCVVMKDGTVLQPKMYSVRKVKFYDECNQELIPNPLAQWHRLDKCILQSVITVNHIHPGDLIEYCTVDNHDQTVTQSSIVTIGDDSESAAYIILKNGTILYPNKHSLRKIDLYDEFKQMLIPNPLADWYRLEKYILTPGSMTPDDDKEHDEFDEPNQTDVSTARAERRRKNKQR